MCDEDFESSVRTRRPQSTLPAELFDLGLARAIALSTAESRRESRVKLSKYNTCAVLPPDEALLDAANRAADMLSLYSNEDSGRTQQPEAKVSSALWNASRTAEP